MLLAGFTAWLRRVTGQSDVVVGTPVAGRERAELEKLIGLFVNTLALRVDVSGEPTLRELVGRARETALGAYGHQDVPFEKVVEELRPARDLSRTPLFQVMFVLQNTPMSKLDVDGLRFESMAQTSSTAKFDLTLSMARGETGFVGSLEYATELFDATTVSRWSAQLVRMLETLAAAPDTRVSEVVLQSAAERTKMLHAWNATSAPIPLRPTIHESFEAQADATPRALALVCGDERLTYAELDARSNQLAHYLRAQGVGPETRVGVCVERSVEMVVTLLGVLKAGGAYVPLDPTYPKDRLAFMVEDAQAPVVVAQGKFASLIGAGRVLSLEAQADAIDACDSSRVGSGATGETLAYVIFTSGSTGRPKGAMNEHAAVVNRLAWMPEGLTMGVGDSVLQKTPFSFDVSVWEFFWPLTHGTTLVMAKPEGHRDAQYVAEMVARHGVTTIHFVPSMLKAFLEQAGVERHCGTLKRIVCSGEALDYELAEECLARIPSARLFNLYGPTETAVEVTWFECSREGGEWRERRSVPIGKPISTVRMYVLDARFEPVPVGVAGELYIGGAAVGRGYLNRAALTSERFVADPHADGGRRMYKTGDLCRRWEDGTIEYQGRLDDQVKVRGYRIELGEIESELRKCDGVRDAAVVAREERGTRSWWRTSSATPTRRPSRASSRSGSRRTWCRRAG